MAAPELTATEARHEQFLADLRERTLLAGEAAGGFCERDFLIAGKRLRLRAAGDDLLDVLTAALEHAAASDTGEPDLTVDVWDSGSTGVGMPPQPWAEEDHRPHGLVDGWFDDALRLVLRRDVPSLSLIEPTRRTGIFWIYDAEALALWERHSPLRPLLHIWLSDHGLQLAHAGAVTVSAGAVLIAGNSGAGKSSTVLACVGSDLGHIGDDFCILEPGPVPTVHALYGSVKSHVDNLERLAIPASWVAGGGEATGEKATIFLDRHEPERMRSSAPLAAVCVSSISGRPETRATQIPPSRALAALAPSTLLQLPGVYPEGLGILGQAVRAVPCYRLEVGTDPAGIPEALASLPTA